MSVTAGFGAGGIACGIKADGSLDLALVAASAPVPAAAVFTRNVAAAAPVILSRENIADGRAQAVVVNSGCANAATGEAGMAAARAMAEATARRLGGDPSDVIVCSTGPIGTTLPVEAVEAGLGRITLDDPAAAAQAILTTDSRPKTAQFRGAFTVGGMAKGAGMIRPDMATMLAVLTTDAVAEPDTLHRLLAAVADRTFNALDIDGCESTNDTVVLLASGAAGFSPHPDQLEAAVEQVCADLALQIADDAEGATRVVTVEVYGAADDATALALARAVADSALVRASFYGADPNWGRILAALGSTRLPIDCDLVTISYAGVVVAEKGRDAGADHDAVADLLAGDFTVTVDLGAGPGTCRLLTTDLTPDYVRFNGERS